MMSDNNPSKHALQASAVCVAGWLAEGGNFTFMSSCIGIDRTM